MKCPRQKTTKRYSALKHKAIMTKDSRTSSAVTHVLVQIKQIVYFLETFLREGRYRLRSVFWPTLIEFPYKLKVYIQWNAS